MDDDAAAWARLDPDQRRVLAALLAMQRQSWEQGVASHALLDLGLTGLAEVVARDAVTRQTAEGKLAEIEDGGIVNSAANGEAVLRAAQHTGDATLREAFDRQVRWIARDAPRADDGTLLHLVGTREVWVDSVYMVLPLLVLAGEVEEAARQLAGHRARLFDEATGLYSARWDEDSARLTLAAPWGTGNGWVVAGIARALHLLGDLDVAGGGDGFRAAAAAHAREVIDACLEHRDEDGVFHDVVTDPATFPETNLAQMLAYAVLTGVADGWLPASYASVGRSLVGAARARVDPCGFVTPVCGAPRFDRPGTSAEAQSFFLLATAAAAAVVDD
ncbi:glycoside hydrolase family 88 protein [Cellulomonas sp. NS3]|uniref:glycoside hydrolase family 88 protein n=1 Tax=Cellulomonas sp. NS3 TaxID=2973977 RepID=UPI002161DEAC|nr:glycoside hydrolase family 88 protein [Cellulomonas sp. NS3]